MNASEAFIDRIKLQVLHKRRESMKLGFAVENNDGLESAVYDHFGSAPEFIIFDTDLKEVQSVDNSNASHVHGACNPVMALGGNRIDALVVGGIGAGAIMKLNAMGVKVYRSGAETIRENIALFEKGGLQEVSMSDSCKSHQGECGHP
jgi:predicted Fe-Mo cluster-binding NifX family protein